MKFLLGTKIGMTQMFKEDGSVVPVTIVKIEPNIVTQIKTKEQDGYQAIQIGTGSKKKLTKPEKGHRRGLGEFAILREARIMKHESGEDIKQGDKLDISI